MGAKLLKLSPIEVRGYRDPVAYFFGYEEVYGEGQKAQSVFQLNADSDDLFSVWVVQYSASASCPVQWFTLRVTSSYSMVMPMGESNPAVMVVDNRYTSDQTNKYFSNTYINPVFAGWKKQNTIYSLYMESSLVGVEDTVEHYIRGYIYRELPDRI